MTAVRQCIVWDPVGANVKLPNLRYRVLELL